MKCLRILPHKKCTIYKLDKDKYSTIITHPKQEIISVNHKEREKLMHDRRLNKRMRYVKILNNKKYPILSL